MDTVQNWFRLEPANVGAGISCGKDGLFVADVPLLERITNPSGGWEWQPRPLLELDAALSKCFDLPIEFTSKMSGLSAVARALDRGDILLAQIAALHLQIPDPPALSKTTRSVRDVTDLAKRLERSGMLKAEWDPSEHPRWPAGSPGAIGGQFEPTDEGGNAAGSAASVIPAQATIPAPFAAPFRLPIPVPRPLEILPPPIGLPNTYPRGVPKEKEEECDEEWAYATKMCRKFIREGKLGTWEYKGMGRSFEECVNGMVSEECGGSSIGA